MEISEKDKLVNIRLVWGDESKNEYEDVEISLFTFLKIEKMAQDENKTIEDKILEIISNMV